MRNDFQILRDQPITKTPNMRLTEKRSVRLGSLRQIAGS